MRKILFPLLILGVAVTIFLVTGKDKEEPGMTTPRETRMLTPEQLLTRVHQRENLLRLRTGTDVLPGGNAAAMAPVMIDWDESRPWAEDPYVIVHNLNHGGNPVDGTTVFSTARIPLNGVEAVEFIFVPLDNIGSEGLIQHGQLRFIFAEDQPIELLNYGDPATGSDPYLRDIVFSWEAWRPPYEGYDVMTGMNPAAYMLSPRLFSGPTRFLDDALGGRTWTAYRLRLPDGRAGLAALLKVELAMSDGVARHTISKILKQSEEEWAAQGPDSSGAAGDLAALEALRAVAAPHPVTADTMINIKDQDLAYQTLLRSCATMALYTVNVAVDRLVAAGHTDGLVMDNLMRPDLGTQEKWMTDLADTDMKGIFLRAPAALRYLREHPEGFPKNIPKQLEKAGLLEMENGKAKKTHYSIDKVTPYGTLKENLIK